MAAPYGLTGRIGVASSWGLTLGSPNISALDACTNATGWPCRSCTARADSSSPTAPSPLTRAVRSGSDHDWATELIAARL